MTHAPIQEKAAELDAGLAGPRERYRPSAAAASVGTTGAERVRTRPLVLVQVLRAFAATLVLVGHALSETTRNAAAVGAGPRAAHLFAGGFGVDLFFAISGFIMVVSSDALFAQPGARETFVKRRLIRLVPLYWLVTLAYVPLLLAGSKGYHGDLPRALIASLAFIPYPTYGVDGSGNVYPLYQLGWTLNYEMFFYLIFALFIGLSRRLAVAAVCLLLASIVGAGLVFEPTGIAGHFWCQPIMLEFAFGALLALAWLGPIRLHPGACLALVICALTYVAMDPAGLMIKTGGSTPDDFRRILGWGLPAAAILAAAVFLEKGRAATGRVISGLRFMGDCSYSLYLVHPFVLIVLMAVFKRLQLGATVGLTALELAVIAGSFMLSTLTYVHLERPLTMRLNRSILTRHG